MKLVKIAAGIAGTSYGVLSAFADRSDSQDLILHDKLKSELEAMGYAPVEARGEWEGVPELCWMVPGMEVGDLVDLARRYEQEAVVFCPQGGHPRVLGVSGVPKPPVSVPGS